MVYTSLVVNLISLFQAPRETREGKGEGTKTRGTGGEKRKEDNDKFDILTC